jgi:hypothetical protein
LLVAHNPFDSFKFFESGLQFGVGFSLERNG